MPGDLEVVGSNPGSKLPSSKGMYIDDGILLRALPL